MKQQIFITIVLVLTMTQITMPIHFINAKQVCEKTTLYPLTLPPGKPERVILCHPVGKELAAANNANIKFNQGIISGQSSSSTKCLSNDTNFCAGWDYAKKYLK